MAAAQKTKAKAPIKKASKPSPKTQKKPQKAKSGAQKPQLQKPVVKKATPASASSLVKNFVRPSLAASFAGGAPVLPSRAQAVVDKMEIADTLYSYARSLDRLDETLLRSVFHADATLDLGPGMFQGTISDYIPWVMGVLSAAKTTQHFIGNVQAQLEGDTALVEAYMQTHMRLDKPTGREDLFVGSRTLDRFDRRPHGSAGVWKIVHRKVVLDWVRTEPVSDIFYHQNPDALWNTRGKPDPSTQMSKFPGGGDGGTKAPSYFGRRYESKSVKI